MKCLLCKKEYKHLGSHLWHGHKIKAREYKKEFGLDLNFPLIDESIKIKKQEAFEKHREKYLKNLKKCGKKYQFKKGHSNVKDYLSRQSHDRYIDNLKEMNSITPETCPICKLKTKKLPSHLFNKHGILVLNKDKFYQK